MSERKVTFGRIFWPSFWAAMIVSVIGLLIWIFVIGAFISGFEGDTGLHVEDKTVLHITLNGDINEMGSSDFDPSTLEMVHSPGLADILHGLEVAKTDKKIKGLFIELDGVSCGFATAQEIRAALEDFGDCGKFVVAYHSGEYVSQLEYYIASAAKENYGFPSTNMQFLGLGAELAYFKNTLDRLGVEMQVIRGSGNDFKSAVEPFFRENMSDSSRLQIERYIHSMWDSYLTDISRTRKIDVKKLDQLAEDMAITDLRDAAEHKLIDGVKYRDEVLNLLADKAGTDKTEELELMPFMKYAKKKFYQDQTIMKTDDPNIAVIVAEGDVSRDGDGLSSEKICKLFREVRADKNIKAVVFRINSPGGSALASDEIWREVKLTTEKKKVIVSMGDLAASGGYYIAAPANAIFAESGTITGSIGVFGMVPYTGDMMKDMLGITFDRASSNSHSILSTNRRITEEEMLVIQKSVDEIYDDFKARVAEGRGMSKAQVEVIARGRVWTGEDAVKIGLVDKIGGMRDAIDYAAEQAGVKKAKVLYYPKVKEDKFEALLEQLSEADEASQENAQGEIPKALLKYYADLRELENYSGIQMRLPYELIVK
jgi:protease-4